ncbi:hypothetical protein EON65_48005 [archaeon]|nr:MAG: hypothetical protein EON65_48005 [archaeon]
MNNRFLLRTKLRNIKEDDRRILWEGADSLNTLELREACKSILPCLANLYRVIILTPL